MNGEKVCETGGWTERGEGRGETYDPVGPVVPESGKGCGFYEVSLDAL